MKKIVMLFIIIFTIFLFSFKNDDSLFDNKKIYDFNSDYNSIQDDIFTNGENYDFAIDYEEQKKIDKEISNYINDKSISFESPKVILNPYKSSPLTALVIFNTQNKTKIKLSINDAFMTTMEESKFHIIPIYGLRENYNNRITLIDDLENMKEIYIKTDKLFDKFYDYQTQNNTNEYLFINTDQGKYFLDNEGYVSWYMKEQRLTFDVNNNKKIYVLDINNILTEKDYLGRISKIYYTNLKYDDHAIKRISNGNFLIIELDGIISEIDYKTGKKTILINLFEIIKEIDSNLKEEIKGFYINYFQYNEKNNSLLLSDRKYNLIINYDLTKKEIIWIFSPNDFSSKNFDKYRLNLTKGSYFMGQHTPYLDGDYLYIFDNNNFYAGELTFDVLNKSSAVIYKINEKNIEEVYRYKSNYSSGWYGSFFEKNKIKTINFGCILDDSNGKYSKIIELNDSNNVISELKTNYDTILIYQSFREKFYDEFTLNYNIDNDLTVIKEENSNNNIKLNYKYWGFKEKIKNAVIDETLIEISNSGPVVNVNETNYEVLFVDYKYDFYKIESNEEEFYLNKFMSQIKGKYAIYLKINNKYYNTNVVFNIN